MRVYSSKTSMSDACFHNFDFNRMIYKAISTDDLPSALANLVVKTPFPAFFACLFKSSFTPSEDSAILCELFGQSFANRFLQNRDFFSTHRNSIPYTRGVLMCLLGQNPAGAKNERSLKHKQKSQLGTRSGKYSVFCLLVYHFMALAFPVNIPFVFNNLIYFISERFSPKNREIGRLTVRP